MEFVPERFYHVYNQGNGRQKLFDPEKDDYLVFLRLTRRYVLPKVDIIAYCLMPNHFHVMIKTDERCLKTRMAGNVEMNEVSLGFRTLLTSFTRIMNSRRGSTGSLFRQGTHARCLEHDSMPESSFGVNQDELTNVFRYIHDNPVKANLVKSPSDWLYSSYIDYAGLREGTLVNKKVAFDKGFALL